MTYIIFTIGVIAICIVVAETVRGYLAARERESQQLPQAAHESREEHCATQAELNRLRRRAMELRRQWIAEGYLTREHTLEDVLNNVDPLVLEERIEATPPSPVTAERTRRIDLT